MKPGLQAAGAAVILPDDSFVRELMERVPRLCGRICDATAMDDEALEQVRIQDLVDYYQEHQRHGRSHPILTEAVADFTEDAAEAVRLYRLALAQAQSIDEPVHTKLIWMAGRLIEIGRLEEAEACLRDGRRGAVAVGDSEAVNQADRVTKDILSKTSNS